MSDFECRVCHAYATGFHFNAQSCQACCAFFRRAIALNRRYLCHRREKSGIACPIVYMDKVLCRACRLEKCLAVGMDKNAVQVSRAKDAEDRGKCRTYFTVSGLRRNKRFASGALGLLELSKQQQHPSSNEFLMNSVPTTTSSASVTASSSTSSLPSSTASSYQRSKSNTTSSPTPYLSTSSFLSASTSSASSSADLPSFVLPIRPISIPKWDLLNLFIEEEMRIAERRRILFCERPVASLIGKSKCCPFSREDLRPLRFQEFRRSIRTHILLVYEWLRVWPAYGLLSISDQITLLRKCVLYHTILDPCFLTIQIGDLSKFVLPNGGYVSTVQDEGWEDEPEISRGTKMSIYWPLLVPLMSNIIAPMLLLSLDFDEFVALKAIVSLQMTLPDISSPGRALISAELSSLCRSLHTLYNARSGFRDELERAERFGNLLLLLSPIFETANTFVESHHIVQFFDLWEMDSLMLQFLKNKS